MTDETGKRQKQVLKVFQETLNRHGYGFQYSVVKLVEQLNRESLERCGWLFEATEFPVEVQGKDTRIDILLKHWRYPPFYIVAECKRANPALSNWCFAPSPYVHSNPSRNAIVLEGAQLDTSNRMHAIAKQVDVSDKAYHVALEVKSNQPGDPQGSGRGAIEEAATQVLRGLNGMVEFLANNLQFFEREQKVDLLPVIFTTAHLWVSDVDLSAADLATGNIDLSTSNFARKDWLLYQYHTAPGLKHSYSPTDQLRMSSTLGRFMEQAYIRTIPIVSASGIAEFLDWSGKLWRTS